MKRILGFVGIFLAGVSLYLLLWPVPIDPVAWQAPADRGLVDPFASNDLLKAATAIDLDPYEGPEDATLGHDGLVYATTASGHVIRIRNRHVEEFAFLGGRPLGIETAGDGSLIVANAYTGLQRVDMSGGVTFLHGGEDADVFANNLAVAEDGTVYFSEASRKFGAKKYRDTLDATLFDIMEHGAHGRVSSYDPASGKIETVVDNLAYANGVAISDSGDFLLVVEMNEYRVLKHWLAGPMKGRTDVLLDNLPGFGDNLRTGLNGRFWLGFAAPRNAIVDRFSEQPFIRKLIQRLPAFVRPEPEMRSHVIAFNGDGEILMNMHDPEARYPMLTGVLETQTNLYLTTLIGKYFPVIAKKDL
jgi:sugar lactone lactonase YvrE